LIGCMVYCPFRYTALMSFIFGKKWKFFGSCNWTGRFIPLLCACTESISGKRACSYQLGMLSLLFPRPHQTTPLLSPNTVPRARVLAIALRWCTPIRWRQDSWYTPHRDRQLGKWRTHRPRLTTSRMPKCRITGQLLARCRARLKAVGRKTSTPQLWPRMLSLTPLLFQCNPTVMVIGRWSQASLLDQIILD